MGSADSSGQCTAEEQAKIARLGPGHGAGSWPQMVGDCANKALHFLLFNRDDMTRCISQAAGISESCAECYSYIGQYGYDNCKKCVLLVWCSHGCLTCTMQSYSTVDKCS